MILCIRIIEEELELAVLENYLIITDLRGTRDGNRVMKSDRITIGIKILGILIDVYVIANIYRLSTVVVKLLMAILIQGISFSVDSHRLRSRQPDTVLNTYDVRVGLFVIRRVLPEWIQINLNGVLEAHVLICRVIVEEVLHVL